MIWAKRSRRILNAWTLFSFCCLWANDHYTFLFLCLSFHERPLVQRPGIVLRLKKLLKHRACRGMVLPVAYSWRDYFKDTTWLTGDVRFIVMIHYILLICSAPSYLYWLYVVLSIYHIFDQNIDHSRSCITLILPFFLDLLTFLKLQLFS